MSYFTGDWSPQPYAGQVRLVGGAYASEGKLEVYLNGEWGAVCSDGFDGIAANSVCRQLGYTRATRVENANTRYIRTCVFVFVSMVYSFFW